MTDTESQNLELEPVAAPRWRNWARNGSFCFLVVILAWAPFPLGSNREWSWGLLSFLVAGCWLLWALWSWTIQTAQWRRFSPLRIPLVLAAITLLWALIQALPIAPLSWVHPIWAQAENVLQRPLHGTISLNPWETLAEIAKLATYILVGLMVFALTGNSDRARQCLNALIAIGAVYAAYAFALHVSHLQQFRLFYGLPFSDAYISGPFVQRNNFATYEGLIALAASAKLVNAGYREIAALRGSRHVFTKSMRFLFGRGTLLIIATLFVVSALFGSGSRGGFLATVAGMAFLAVSATIIMRHKLSLKKIAVSYGILICILLALLFLSGALLMERMQNLVDAGSPDLVRVALWKAAERMIQSAPALGLGLGTFSDAYPLYATGTFPYIMDRAHNDFLEFVAGLGVPAALFWWAAWAMLLGRMIYGAFIRRKNRMYPLIGAGATILVAVHSLVDFSLQIPAVSITYAALLGLGLAQSIPSGAGAQTGEAGPKAPHRHQ